MEKGFKIACCTQKDVNTTFYISVILFLRLLTGMLLIYYCYATVVPARGRILGRNWDNSFKSFPPCHSQSPPPPLSKKSSLKLVCNVNIVNGNLKSENSQDLNKIVHSWIRLQESNTAPTFLQAGYATTSTELYRANKQYWKKHRKGFYII